VVKVVRPLIGLLNRISNVLVRLCRVAPRDELASVHNREQLTHLIEESERLGLISESDSDLLTRSLTEPETPVEGLRIPAAEITSVDGAASVEDILAQAAAHDRTRLLVREGGEFLARDLARPVPAMPGRTTVADAIELLRRNRASLAVVRDETGRVTGMVALDDLLARYLQPQT
jgi:CBS domain containing-hemolysin-like protein